jgi:hypothetical protein
MNGSHKKIYNMSFEYNLKNSQFPDTFTPQHIKNSISADQQLISARQQIYYRVTQSFSTNNNGGNINGFANIGSLGLNYRNMKIINDELIERGFRITYGNSGECFDMIDPRDTLPNSMKIYLS